MSEIHEILFFFSSCCYQLVLCGALGETLEAEEGEDGGCNNSAVMRSCAHASLALEQSAKQRFPELLLLSRQLNTLGKSLSLLQEL